jgi:hypothetical protein
MATRAKAKMASVNRRNGQRRKKRRRRGRKRKDATKGKRKKGRTESDGDTPRGRVVEERETEVDPVGYHGTGGDHGGFDENGETTRLGLRALGVPGGDSGRLETGTETSDDATDDELNAGLVTRERSDLNEDTDEENGGTDVHHLATTCGERVSDA